MAMAAQMRTIRGILCCISEDVSPSHMIVVPVAEIVGSDTHQIAVILQNPGFTVYGGAGAVF